MNNKEQKKEGTNKFDLGKLRMDLISVPALMGVAEVYTHGAIKYGDTNWLKGCSWSRLLGALLRHLIAFMCNVNVDVDSKLNHIDQVTWNSMALSHYQKMNIGNDNREMMYEFFFWFMKDFDKKLKEWEEKYEKSFN